MTANEMRNTFKELYDGASAQEMGFDDIEVSRFLNLAQDIIIQEKYFSNRNAIKEGFEIGSKRDIELNHLKRNITLWYDMNTDGSSRAAWEFKDELGDVSFTVTLKEQDSVMDEKVILFNIPTNIMFIVRDTVDLSINDKLYRWITVKNINEDEVIDTLNNPFRKPDKTVVYRTTLIQNISTTPTRFVKLFLPTIYESVEFKRWNCMYIKYPTQIVVNILAPTSQVNCELHESVHKDIIIKAVELALGSIGSQKVQVAMYNSNKNIN